MMMTMMIMMSTTIPQEYRVSIRITGTQTYRTVNTIIFKLK